MTKAVYRYYRKIPETEYFVHKTDLFTLFL